MNQNLEDGKTVPEPFALSSGALATQIICYDLRFPELLRYPSREGAQIAFYVAEWQHLGLIIGEAYFKLEL